MCCAACGKPYEEEEAGLPAGPRLASAIPQMCVSCVAENFDSEWWQCLPFYPEPGDIVIYRGTLMRVDTVVDDRVTAHPEDWDGHQLEGWWDAFEPVPIEAPV